MSYGIGQFVGGVLAIAILSAAGRLVLKRFFEGNSLIVITTSVAVLVATFLYAFGSADGGEPRFGAGLAQYGFGGVVVLFGWLFWSARKKSDD